ncbi:flavin reductase family protein [Alicyclobacillus dauci]|uniref:Flavin reductase family protein n=1 Tax=Alicyclobacillus dauci TaxID=1475485 RepID=A0ABY6Z7X7_9BACL|nr:flavin reductase family protein [Alicyclobacillus dauci]WAH38692.1 flavin reductase family protein [Alicyclobacillus dauci]
MLSLMPEQMTERDNYKFLIGSIIPRPVAFVTTLSETGTLNAAPFSYFNVVTANPPLISVSVQRVNGVPKDTARNAMAQKAFVVHVCDETNVEAINQTSATLPASESEVEFAHLTPVDSLKIPVPGVMEAKIRMECTLETVVQLGGTPPSCDLLIGRVVAYHIDDALYNNGRIDPVKLQPIARLAGNDYARLGDIFTLARPK